MVRSWKRLSVNCFKKLPFLARLTAILFILATASILTNSVVIHTEQELEIKVNKSKSHKSISNIQNLVKVNSVSRTTWLRITDNIYIYSSYWDNRKELRQPIARTFGIWRYNRNLTVKKDKFFETGEILAEKVNINCTLWSKLSNTPTIGTLEIWFFEEKRNDFVGVNLLCIPPPNREESKFYAVSYFPKDNANYPHKLSYLMEAIEYSRKLSNQTSICVRPLFGPYSETWQLLQFIIYYKTILSIDTFYFYDLAINFKTKELLVELMDFGVNIEILNWNLPTGNTDELWDYGALVATNDCLYRSMSSHLFTIIVDIDEFIVPKLKIDTNKNLYENLIEDKKGNFGDSVLIPNAFFCKNFESNSETKVDFIKYQTREARVWPASLRSKMMVMNRSVLWVGHHLVTRFVDVVNRNLGVSSTKVILNHYRRCDRIRRGIDGKGALVLKQKKVKDKSALRYQNKVLSSELYKAFASRYNGFEYIDVQN